MPKILVVDDEIFIRDIIYKTLAFKGYQVVAVPSAEQALELIFKEPFDLILLDIDLGGQSGISVLKKIRAVQKKIPVVIYSGILTPELDIAVRAAGATEAISKSVAMPQLVEQIRKIIGAKDRILQDPLKRKEKNILIVDDEVGIRNILKTYFESKRFKVFEASSGEDALKIVSSESVSAVLLDINMPGIDGLETLTRLLKIDPKLGVVMVTTVKDNEKVNQAVKLGAYGYVLKPFDFLYLDLVVMSKIIIAGSE